jgi:hypothetical protein
MGLRPTQGDENQVEEGLIGNYTYLCHLSTSLRSGRDDKGRQRLEPDGQFS